jgi:hypothetical protein
MDCLLVPLNIEERTQMALFANIFCKCVQLFAKEISTKHSLQIIMRKMKE